jgi:hypothetical protein
VNIAGCNSVSNKARNSSSEFILEVSARSGGFQSESEFISASASEGKIGNFGNVILYEGFEVGTIDSSNNSRNRRKVTNITSTKSRVDIDGNRDAVTASAREGGLSKFGTGGWRISRESASNNFAVSTIASSSNADISGVANITYASAS